MVFQRLNPVHLFLMGLASPIAIPVAICLLPLIVLAVGLKRR